MNCELERNTLAENNNKDKADRYYDALIHGIEFADDHTVATCEFLAGQRFGKKIKIEISATYVVGYFKKARLSRGDERALIEFLVKNSVWPRFIDLFSAIVSQAGENLPNLSVSLPKVAWDKEVEKKKVRKA